MQFPESIFGIIVMILVGYTIRNFKIYQSKKNSKRLMGKIFLSIMLIGLSWIWFVPMHVGQIGESPVCKFRFQVYQYDVHDYSGYGDIQDVLIRTKPAKYGTIHLQSKIGGWKEYFGLNRAEYQTDEEYFGKETE